MGHKEILFYHSQVVETFTHNYRKHISILFDQKVNYKV